MKIPHIIEKWIARYSDGEAEGAQKKLMDDWVQNSPGLQKEIEDQQTVASHLNQSFSNPAVRAQMEAKLKQTLSTLPNQVQPDSAGWSLTGFITSISSIRLRQISRVSSRTLGTVVVVMFLGIFAVINGPVTPPNVGMHSYQSQSDAEWTEALTDETALFSYFYTDEQVNSKGSTESTESRGIFGLPGIVSNSRDDGIDRDQSVRFREDTRLSLGRAAANERFGSIPDGEADFGVNSLGYTLNYANQNIGMGMGSMGMGAMGGGMGSMGVDDDLDGIQDRYFIEAAPTNPDSFHAAGSEIAGKQTEQSISSIVPNTGEPPLVAIADTSTQSLEPEEPDASKGRRIIRNARMSLQVPDVLAAKDRVEAMIRTVRGLISNASINQDASVPSAQLILWVPAEGLEQVIEELNTLGKALNLEVFTNDVTEQYFDMESRVRNLKIQEERLLALYEREVKKLDEILQVEREVQRVRTEIEQLEGRKRLWDRQISLSTIEVTIIQEPAKKPIVQSEPDSVLSPLRRVWRDAGAVFLYSCSIMTGLAASVLSTVIFFLPWMVLLTGIGVAGRLIWKRLFG